MFLGSAQHNKEIEEEVLQEGSDIKSYTRVASNKLDRITKICFNCHR